jgi:hypothetical protein
MFYYLDIDGLNGTQRHILQRLGDGGVMSFPLTDDNPNKTAYDAWVAEGNTAEEWEIEDNS